MGKILKIKYPEIGICGLSCYLCPNYNTNAKSKCNGCKSEGRINVGCPFITCALNFKNVEFCWECSENIVCEKWKKHRETGKNHDSFKCYQKLEDDINFIMKNGINKFVEIQRKRALLLQRMLTEFNEGRSKSYFCIAATIFDIDELTEALKKSSNASNAKDIKEKSRILHFLLDEIASKKKYLLKLRK